MIDHDFLFEFKRTTESKWKDRALHPHIYGFQFQPGTRWNSGLPDDLINEYAGTLNVRFPHDFKAFLRSMNGTDLPTLNIYGSSGTPPQHSIGVYSYPRDLKIVQLRMEVICDDRSAIGEVLAEQGFHLSPDSGLVPIFAHRYVVCETNPDRSVVLSIHGTDAIVYASSLQEYLVKEFLEDVSI